MYNSGLSYYSDYSDYYDDVPYLFGGKSISLNRTSISNLYIPQHVIYATTFLSIHNLTMISITSWFGYDAERSIIKFDFENDSEINSKSISESYSETHSETHSESISESISESYSETENEYYLSIAETQINPIQKNGTTLSWDYFLDIDLRKLNASNMCGINYRYTWSPIVDINRYGLNDTEYSFINDSTLYWKYNMSDENTEYLRDYVKQMIRPFSKRFEVMELNETVSNHEILIQKILNNSESYSMNDDAVQDLVDEVQKLNISIENLNSMILDLMVDVENSIMILNGSLNELSNSVSNNIDLLNDTINDLTTEINMVNESLNENIENTENIESWILNININDLYTSVVTVEDSISQINNILNEVVNALNITDVIDDKEHSTQSSSDSDKIDILEIVVIIMGIVIIAHIIFTVGLCFLIIRKNKHNGYADIN